MRKTFAALLLIFLPALSFGQFVVGQGSFMQSGGGGAIAPVNSPNSATCFGGNCTTPPVNMSGASLITVSVASYICSTSSPAVTDSSGNTYLTAVAQNNYPAICLYYVCGPTVTSAMTFTYDIPSGYANGVVVDGYTNVKASSCADGAAVVAGLGSSPINTGSVTPSANDDVCVAVGGGDVTSGATISFSSPSQTFTTFDQISNGINFSTYSGYYVQTTATTLSTSFTDSAPPWSTGFNSVLQCFLHV